MWKLIRSVKDIAFNLSLWLFKSIFLLKCIFLSRLFEGIFLRRFLKVIFDWFINLVDFLLRRGCWLLKYIILRLIKGIMNLRDSLLMSASKIWNAWDAGASKIAWCLLWWVLLLGDGLRERDHLLERSKCAHPCTLWPMKASLPFIFPFPPAPPYALPFALPPIPPSKLSPPFPLACPLKFPASSSSSSSKFFWRFFSSRSWYFRSSSSCWWCISSTSCSNF